MTADNFPDRGRPGLYDNDEWLSCRRKEKFTERRESGPRSSQGAEANRPCKYL